MSPSAEGRRKQNFFNVQSGKDWNAKHLIIKEWLLRNYFSAARGENEVKTQKLENSIEIEFQLLPFSKLNIVCIGLPMKRRWTLTWSRSLMYCVNVTRIMLKLCHECGQNTNCFRDLIEYYVAFGANRISLGIPLFRFPCFSRRYRSGWCMKW